MSFPNCFWFSLTALMQQGQPTMPSSFSSRLVFISVWISAVVLFAAYTSNLVSFFTVKRESFPVNNLRELVDSNMKFGTRTGSIYVSNLQNSPNPVQQEAYARIQEFEDAGDEIFFSSTEKAIERIMNGSYALIADYVVLDYYQRKDCKLVLLKEQMFRSVASFALPQNSVLLEPFNYYLSRLRDGGVLDKLHNEWWKSIACGSDDSSGSLTSHNSVELMDVISAFAVLGAGMILGVSSCALEYLSTRVLLLEDVTKVEQLEEEKESKEFSHLTRH